jgi:hypothetical protein
MFISEMVEKYPELMQELKTVTQPQHLNTLSPGVKSSVNKELNRLFRKFPDY